jgi:hypothetical protein
VQNGNGEQVVGLAPVPLKVESPTLVTAVFPDPIEVGAEMLPVCPGGEVSKAVLPELP